MLFFYRSSFWLCVLVALATGCTGSAVRPGAGETPVASTGVVPMATGPVADPGATGVTGATPSPVPPVANQTAACVEDYRPGLDYFPDKAEPEHATGFSVAYFDHYKVVTILNPWPGAEGGFQYVLVQCGAPRPDGYDGALMIEIPVRRFVSMSTTYLPHLESLGLIDRLVGLDSAAFVYNPAIRQRYEAGDLREIGVGAEVNVEQALDLQPDVVMTFGSGSPEFDAHPKLLEAGIPVVLNADFTEPSPLGRAEWIKYLAVFFNAEAGANAWFAAVTSDYQRLAGLAVDVADRPTVFTESPFGGTWYVPAGDSYTARLLADAGAAYLWAEEPGTGSLFLDFESVFDRAAAADFWLNVGVYASREDLLAADERFAEFAAFTAGRIYNHDARTGPDGGNDFFESGAANPHKVLADLIAIFHSDLLPEHKLVYYRQLD